MALPGVFNTAFLSVITIGSDPHKSSVSDPHPFYADADPAPDRIHALTK
jgi:hypothetical protein